MIGSILIVAGALGAGVFIGADCTKQSARAKVAEAQVDRDLAHHDAVEAQTVVGLLTGELHATKAELGSSRLELEMVEEQLALAHASALGAQHLAKTWESRAQSLATTLEERCGPAIVEPSDVVLLFRPGQGFQGFA